MVFKKSHENKDRTIYQGYHADLEFTICRYKNPDLSDTLFIWDSKNNKPILNQKIDKPSESMMQYHYGGQ